MIYDFSELKVYLVVYLIRVYDDDEQGVVDEFLLIKKMHVLLDHSDHLLEVEIRDFQTFFLTNKIDIFEDLFKKVDVFILFEHLSFVSGPFQIVNSDFAILRHS